MNDLAVRLEFPALMQAYNKTGLNMIAEVVA